MEISAYKDRLIDYLRLKGINAENGSLIRCINPDHNDSTASCQVNEDYCFCHSRCGKYDIYDAVEYLEGITSLKEKQGYLASIFGGDYVPELATEKAKKETGIEIDAACMAKVKNFCMNASDKNAYIKNFFHKRAMLHSDNTIQNYPEPILEKLYPLIGYWQGQDAADRAFSRNDYEKSGLISKKTDRLAWFHEGIVIQLGKGLKLHYYKSDDARCYKINSRGCQCYPTPSVVDKSKPVVLVEGELDALICYASGLTNVVSCGGTRGLTKTVIKEELLGISELVIMFDNDEAGSQGALNAVKNLSKNGFAGTIKIASLAQYKDPDDCILHNRIDLITSAVNNAILAPASAGTARPGSQDSESSDPKVDDGTPSDRRGSMTLKDFKKILSLLPYDSFDKDELKKFVEASVNATAQYTDAVKLELVKWGAKEADLASLKYRNPSYIAALAEKRGMSYYYIRKIKDATLTAESARLNASKVDELPFFIDFKKLKDTSFYRDYMRNGGEKSAANMCAHILQKRLVYTEELDCFYYFNGHVWTREPNPCGIVYNILRYVITKSIAETKDDDLLRPLYKKLDSIETRRYRSNVVKDLSALNGIWYEKIQFDGIAIKETLTLLDGVIDFSGAKDKKIHYRQSRPEEFRMKMLPYRIDEVRNSLEPKEYNKFMKGNFKNKDTLDMLNWYVSLIPSRCADYKCAGIFVGKSHTGKTTTINILQDIYSYYQDPASGTAGEKQNMLVPMKRESIMQQGRFGRSSTGPDPFMAELVGAGAAYCDETDQNDRIDSATFKSLTGGGQLTVRAMWRQPLKFKPTAQIIISTNYSPKFNSKDTAVINRMIVVPFSVVHEPGKEGTKSDSYFLEKLRPEYPAIVKMYAEKYLEVKYKYNGKIPVSKEAAAYKDDYVEQQSTPLTQFVDNYIEFVKDDSAYVPLKDIYHAYLAVNDFAVDENGKPIDKDAWTQTLFTKYFRGDYMEVRIKQKRLPGFDNPVQVVLNCRLKENIAPKIKTEPQRNLGYKGKYEPPPYESAPDDEIPFD